MLKALLEECLLMHWYLICSQPCSTISYMYFPCCAGSRGTPPRLPAVMSGQQLAAQDDDVPNGADVRLRLPGGSGYTRTGSLPTSLAGPPGGRRWSVDAADDGQADAVRRGARLRCVRSS